MFRFGLRITLFLNKTQKVTLFSVFQKENYFSYVKIWCSKGVPSDLTHYQLATCLEYHLFQCAFVTCRSTRKTDGNQQV